MKSYHLKEYFYYTRLERNAALTLIVLCLLFFFAPLFYPFLLPPKPSEDFSEIKAAAAMLAARNIEEEEKTFKTNRREEWAPPESIVLYKFDPNEISKEAWIGLGVSARTAQTILNYRSKGGKFLKKEDLKRIYGFRIEDYNRLEDYITIPTTITSEVLPKQKNHPEKIQDSSYHQFEHGRKYHVSKITTSSIDINRATQEEWQQLNGIGPAFSKRIVNYREKLGGFSSIEQVGETYGLPDSTFQMIAPFLTDSPVFRKINLNTATLDELKNHPYISNLQATILFNYRQQHGDFQSMDAVKKAAASSFNETDWERLEPYLDVQ